MARWSSATDDLKKPVPEGLLIELSPLIEVKRFGGIAEIILSLTA